MRKARLLYHQWHFQFACRQYARFELYGGVCKSRRTVSSQVSIFSHAPAWLKIRNDWLTIGKQTNFGDAEIGCRFPFFYFCARLLFGIGTEEPLGTTARVWHLIGRVQTTKISTCWRDNPGLLLFLTQLVNTAQKQKIPSLCIFDTSCVPIIQILVLCPGFAVFSFDVTHCIMFVYFIGGRGGCALSSGGGFFSEVSSALSPGSFSHFLRQKTMSLLLCDPSLSDSRASSFLMPWWWILSLKSRRTRSFCLLL